MKKIGIFIVLIGILFSASMIDSGCTSLAAESQSKVASDLYAKVPLIRLLANPKEFDGRKVLTEGVFQFALGNSALYASKEWYKNGVTANAVALRLDIKPSQIQQYEQWTGSYVVIQGTFDANDCGDSCLLSGAIKNITYVRVVKKLTK